MKLISAKCCTNERTNESSESLIGNLSDASERMGEGATQFENTQVGRGEKGKEKKETERLQRAKGALAPIFRVISPHPAR